MRELLDDTNQGETVFSSNPNGDIYIAENPTTVLMSNVKEFAGLSVFRLI